MATAEHFRGRMSELVRELREEFPAWDVDGECLLAQWENQAVALGDCLAQEWMRQQADCQPPSTEAHCPACGAAGEWKQDRQRRLQSRRGEIELTEPEYFCQACRKSFFPSDLRARCGTGLPADAGDAA